MNSLDQYCVVALCVAGLFKSTETISGINQRSVCNRQVDRIASVLVGRGKMDIDSFLSRFFGAKTKLNLHFFAKDPFLLQDSLRYTQLVWGSICDTVVDTWRPESCSSLSGQALIDCHRCHLWPGCWPLLLSSRLNWFFFGATIFRNSNPFLTSTLALSYAFLLKTFPVVHNDSQCVCTQNKGNGNASGFLFFSRRRISADKFATHRSTDLNTIGKSNVNLHAKIPFLFTKSNARTGLC